jgi:hypothetical protein
MTGRAAMSEDECRNKIRCGLSDRSGVLRFESFDIVDAPECAEIAYGLRAYLVGRALAEVDVGHLQEVLAAEHPLCGRVVVRLVTDSQEMFARPGKRGT